ncbi:hypothetical protein FHS15_003780 [Paenibacillus castaneae]|uniref:general stress protein n=1 Tax=Paenibacillus castaneae TaxID=474957 RepID=UPI000C9AA730|nr:general stress protein [Paenibacillus castaneae]NIK78634.1 hypothetical protein [Paenibacillus castaneae]
MTRKIGIFETEQQALTAIQQLEQAGFVPGELRVLAKDSEHSRRIESESDVHADELRELEDMTNRTGGFDDTGIIGATGYNGLGLTAAMAMPINGSSSYMGGSFPLAVSGLFGGSNHERSLQTLGLSDKESQICGQALQSGSLIVIAETDESKSLLDKEGGPDLSRLGKAEAVFRQCHASKIVEGA